ncbi:MAG: universal stress protein [bacterium]|nr:universal stress protein [bacterium]
MEIPKISISKILYTTDLSERGRYAFAYAASLAHAYGAELTVFHVVETDPHVDARVIGYISEKEWETIKKHNLEEARDILVRRKRDDAYIKDCVGEFCESVQKTSPEQAYVSYRVVTESGHPMDEILKEADKGNYDLIVMGSHGKGNLTDAMIGSVSRRVMRRSNIPVLLVRHADSDGDE